MANIKSAIKRIQITKIRTERNKMVKSSIKTAIKKFEAAVEKGNYDEAKALLSQASHLIDKAAAKGVIHKNNAARKKSRLAIKLNKTAANQ
ncbi:small subunit ribosomal protein S20 [Caloramator quimbayensis]|uniref:Small ribosomal subunit protein bS20 n=1 Tax=Caloramator quimbayensis TaxID=1147123 RepID=A0A1T4XZM5_9CLOT|nr:30S ribosomal protein S20 [Caloramator quimbayensis]SKA94813.1 small subunit ribosomal protein S20 [Caloramator quimbayensis]